MKMYDKLHVCQGTIPILSFMVIIVFAYFSEQSDMSSV